SLRYIALPNWFHEAHIETRNSDAPDGCNANVSENSGISNPTDTSKVPSVDQVKPVVSLTVESEIPTVSSPIPTVCLDVSPESSSVDTPVQTRHKSKEMEEQSFIATIHQKTNPDLLQFCLFSCFLSQEKPKKGKDGPSKDVELHLYRTMIGSLMYLTTFRPNIMFAVCACARHQVTPKEYHIHVVKRIFRFLKGHPKLRLWYLKESPFNLVAYSDSDYSGAIQDRKSTTGGCQFLGRRLILWQCKKQTIMAISTTEAEYVAAASGCGQVL
nr:putative ribonuclease H-like domain-containing protein [Tanacetum cinerariifolium]